MDGSGVNTAKLVQVGCEPILPIRKEARFSIESKTSALVMSSSYLHVWIYPANSSNISRNVLGVA